MSGRTYYLDPATGLWQDYGAERQRMAGQRAAAAEREREERREREAADMVELRTLAGVGSDEELRSLFFQFEPIFIRRLGERGKREPPATGLSWDEARGVPHIHGPAFREWLEKRR